MDRLKAVVRKGRLVLDVPCDLPEGSVVELAVIYDACDEDPELLEELAASAEDEGNGHLLDFEAVMSPFGTKRSTRPR